MREQISKNEATSKDEDKKGGACGCSVCCCGVAGTILVCIGAIVLVVLLLTGNNYDSSAQVAQAEL